MHCVPAAKDWTADQVPEPHCWNEVPPMQFQRPSGVQAEPAVIAPAAPEDDAGEADALAAGAAEVAATGVAEVAATGAAEVTADVATTDVAMVVAAGLLAAAVVAKTPGASVLEGVAADDAAAPEDPAG